MEESSLFVQNGSTSLAEHGANLATEDSMTTDASNESVDSHTSERTAPDSPMSTSMGVPTSGSVGAEEQAVDQGEQFDTQNRPPINEDVDGDVNENHHSENEAENESDYSDAEEVSYINSQLPSCIQKELKDLLRYAQGPHNPENDDPSTNLQSCNPYFRQAQEACEAIANGINDLFARGPRSDSSIEAFSKRLKRQSKFRPPKLVTIAFMGDSGAGKSSLNNSLLSILELATTSGGSRACTNNIIEYCYCFENQMAPFEIHVYFHNLDERRKIIEELFQKLVAHQQTPLDMESDEYQLGFLESESAIEIFQALFRNHDEFSSEARSRSFLSNATGLRNDPRLTKMHDWVEQLVSEYHLNDDVMHLEAGTPSEFSKKIGPFVRALGADFDELSPPSPWPLVQLVKVGLDSELLRHGIIIADVPGISDINRTRVKNANQYLPNCDFLLVCAPMARSVTNPQTSSYLAQAFRSHGSRKALIMTKIDDIKDDIAIQTRFEEHRNLIELRTERHNVENELKSLYEQKKSLKRKRRTEQGVQDRIDELAEYQPLLETVEKGRCIQIRVGNTTPEMQVLYKERTKDQERLEVWGVSNSEYEKHLKNIDGVGFPIPIEYTGIPSLRLRLKELAETAKVETLKLYIKNALPNVLTRAEIWSQPQAEKRHERLGHIVAAGVQDCNKYIESHETALNVAVQALLLDSISENLDDWTRKARDLSSSWTNKAIWNVNTFYAWVKKMGKHKTRAKEFVDWNEQLLKPVNDTLIPAWRAFDGLLADTFDSLIKSLRGLVDLIEEELGKGCNDSSLPLRPFYDQLSIQKALIEQRITEERTGFSRSCK